MENTRIFLQNATEMAGTQDVTPSLLCLECTIYSVELQKSYQIIKNVLYTNYPAW